MAIQEISGLRNQSPMSAEFGNDAIAIVEWETSSFPQNDLLRVFRIPRGAVIYSVEMCVTDASDASVTAKIGYNAIEADDDDDYFMSAQALSAVGIFESRNVNKHKPLRFNQREVYLSAIIEGAAITQATKVTFYIHYEWKGGK